MVKNFSFNSYVYYEDTDAGGIVYYANYLKFMERARTEMIYDLFNLNHKSLKKIHDIIFIVRSCNIQYLKPAKFEDNIQVNTKVLKKSPVRLRLSQEIKRKKELLSFAEVELAVINSKGKINKIPTHLLKKL
jgi:acyl-CoA thioester hydrolase|tara:strand:- start:869 stop:1264 length:396 start_codon:yes stop_codon:yes gene_type:complete